MLLDPIFVAFSIGLLGAGHCLGMCGGIAAALSFALPADDQFKRFRILFTYNTGRILSYALVGLVFGLIGQSLLRVGFQEYAMPVMRSLAGLLLILMGLYLAQWSRLLVYLEKGGAFFWARIKPIGDRLMPVKNEGQALVLGMVWGWLPCGLVYSTLAYAMAQPSALGSAATMAAFGLGTLPAVFLGGLAGAGLKAQLQSKVFRKTTAAILVTFGCWTIGGAYYHVFHHNHSLHYDHESLIDDPYCQSRMIPSQDV